MAIWRMGIACCIPKATNTHKLNLCNTHCFSTTRMVVGTRLIVTLDTACLVVLHPVFTDICYFLLTSSASVCSADEQTVSLCSSHSVATVTFSPYSFCCACFSLLQRWLTPNCYPLLPGTFLSKFCRECISRDFYFGVFTVSSLFDALLIASHIFTPIPQFLSHFPVAINQCNLTI
jgi:hypothetical protein